MHKQGGVKSFTDLYAWQEGHKLVLSIYKLTATFPNQEMYGLCSQMRRCAVSITSNLAEGFGRRSYKEKLQFYYVALGSLTELQNQIIIARDVGYPAHQSFAKLDLRAVLVHKITNGLIKKTREILDS